MIPPRIVKSFGSLPADLIGVCRPHSWTDLIKPPGVGMRPIRDILVHMMGCEGWWIDHVVRGRPNPDFQPEAFGDLDAILSVWGPRRADTVQFVQSLTPEQWSGTRTVPPENEYVATVGEMVWHVVTHDQYHRGQIFTRLALLGRRDLPDYDMLR